jgi:hypothetical protein
MTEARARHSITKSVADESPASKPCSFLLSRPAFLVYGFIGVVLALVWQ